MTPRPDGRMGLACDRWPEASVAKRPSIASRRRSPRGGRPPSAVARDHDAPTAASKDACIASSACPAAYHGRVPRSGGRRPDVAVDARHDGATPDVAGSPWRRLTRRVAYENPWLTVWHDEVIRPDGAPGIYGVVHFANRAIGVLAIDDTDRVLLVGQHRYPLDAYSWEIPEGGGGPNESALDAARRELVEETGFRAGTWRELGRAALSNSVTDELATFFVATDLRGGTASPEGTEELQTRWVPFDEALAMTFDGRISDALSILALQREALDRRPALTVLDGRPSAPR